jgi:hypothetical protein
MTDPPPFVGMLVEGAILAVPLIVIAFLLSRFTRDIVGRSLLVIFLFVAAGHTSDSPFWQPRVRCGC